MNRKLYIITVLILALILNGCVSSRKGSLSDVFNEEDSNGGYYEDEDDDSDLFIIFDIDDEDDDYYEKDRDRDTYDETESDTLVDLNNENYTKSYGLSLGHRLIPFNNLKSATNLSFIFGGYNNEEAVDSSLGGFIKAGLLWTENRPSNSNYETENDSLYGVTAGIEIRKNLTKRDRDFYIDAMVDAEVAYSFWEYTEPKRYDGSDYYIDGLPSFGLGVGLSLCFWNQDDWALLIDPTVGGLLFGDYSFQGFTNDVFQPYIYAQLMVKLMHIEQPEVKPDTNKK